MLTLLQTSLQIFVAFTCLVLTLPSTLSMSVLSDLNPLETVDDELTKYNTITPAFTKRQLSGADPWSICPNSMERVDCFFEYLRVYARLRKATAVSDSVAVRNIGKRVDYSTIRTDDPCPEGTNPDLCLLSQLGATEDEGSDEMKISHFSR